MLLIKILIFNTVNLYDRPSFGSYLLLALRSRSHLLQVRLCLSLHIYKSLANIFLMTFYLLISDMFNIFQEGKTIIVVDKNQIKSINQLYLKRVIFWHCCHPYNSPLMNLWSHQNLKGSYKLLSIYIYCIQLLL